jgi:hypothetical protein
LQFVTPQSVTWPLPKRQPAEPEQTLVPEITSDRDICSRHHFADGVQFVQARLNATIQSDDTCASIMPLARQIAHHDKLTAETAFCNSPAVMPSVFGWYVTASQRFNPPTDLFRENMSVLP